MVLDTPPPPSKKNGSTFIFNWSGSYRDNFFFLICDLYFISLEDMMLLTSSHFSPDNDCHSFSASHHRYTLYFKGWYQQNDVHNTKRRVRRRPADFVTKQNMKDIAQRYEKH